MLDRFRWVGLSACFEPLALDVYAYPGWCLDLLLVVLKSLVRYGWRIEIPVSIIGFMFHVTIIWSRVKIMTRFGHILKKHVGLVPALGLWGLSCFVLKLNLELASVLVYRYFCLIFNLDVMECSIELVNHAVANSISKLFIEESMTRALLGLA